MNVTEEMMVATPDSNGQLQWSHRPRVPGPVRVTIGVIAAVSDSQFDVPAVVSIQGAMRQI